VSARPVMLAVLLAAMLAGDASAQSLPTYGGGRLQTAAIPRGYEPTVGISIQPRGAQIAVRFDTTLRCGRESFEVSGRKVVPYDGSSFSATGASIANVARGRLAFEWTLSAALSGPAASGTLRIAGARRLSGRVQRCAAKPTRAFEAKLAGPPAGAGARPRSRGLYVGTSSYEVVDRLQAPVVMRASKDARKVTARWTIAATCRRGGRERIVNLTPPTRVRADGRFSRKERYLVRYLDATVRYRASFAGRFAGDGATGTLRLRARVYNRSGTRLRTRCDSGTRTWSTSRVTAPVTVTPAPGSSPAPAPTPTPGEPREAVPGAWSLTMTSDPGDYIGQGRSWSHGPSTDTLRVWGEPAHVRLWLTNPEGWWDGNFAAPPGQQLRAGTTYENAHRYPFNDGSPGLDVGGYGRGCNELTGRFRVDRLAFDPDGTLRTFQVTFEQHCEHAQPALRGTWTFNAR
jgi:hypothetical protein